MNHLKRWQVLRSVQPLTCNFLPSCFDMTASAPCQFQIFLHPNAPSAVDLLRDSSPKEGSFMSSQSDRRSPTVETIRKSWAQTGIGKDSSTKVGPHELEEYYTQLAGSVQLRVLAMRREVKSVISRDMEEVLSRHIDEIEKEFSVISDIVLVLLQGHQS